ncbi:MAG: hypothetical protein N3D84_02210 [Candidatus Woesearchaeota archaeon]|nr:hypothetical protein [Candidatus Woesearchaeota archaeon]
MIIEHIIENTSVSKEINEKEINDWCFILTNKKGGYLSLSERPVSRYQGAFFNDNFRMFKAVNSIVPFNAGRIIKIVNRFYSIERHRENGLIETFMMPLYYDSIIYKTNKEGWIEITLDARESYDMREFGRYYEIEEQNDKIIISYTKKTDSKEDNSHGKKEYSIYVVINKNGCEYEKIGRFVEESYPFDQRRNSMPFSRYVYTAIKIKSSNIVISFSTSKEKAIKENDNIIKNTSSIIQKQQIYVNGFNKKIKDKEVMMAYKAACLSLDHLLMTINGKKGVYAGLWWFFHYWSRDEAISLKALMLQEKYDVVKDILIDLLKAIDNEGKIKACISDEKCVLKSADASGWVMKRWYDFFEELYKKKLVTEYLSPSDIELIKNKVEDCVYNLIDKSTYDDLAHNEKKETWMDTEYANDSREGYRIEIQALRLCIYKLMGLLCRATNDKVGEKIAKKLEDDLKKKVQKDFWNGKYLDDGLNDKTIRPNVFIAYYLYPELLSKSQWKECFRNVLPKLWNGWGGLSTIDKSDKLYCDSYTGEDNKSYHRGDSWFWINNLAALCMLRLSKLRFNDYINKVVEASTKEILWQGAIGHHAELSSSSNLESNGCLMQAWSAAMYIELIKEMF